MATIDLGKIKPVWKGTWAGSTAYEKNDMVVQGVNSYICTTAHTSSGTFSSDTANWDVMAYGAELPAQSGNAGKALLTDGTNLEWGNGGGLILLASGELTGTEVSVLSLDYFTTDYSHYVIYLDGWTTVNTSSQLPFMRLRAVSGGERGASQYIWSTSHPYATSGGANHNSHGMWNGSYFGLNGTNGVQGGSNPATGGCNTVIHIHDPMNSNRWTNVNWQTTSMEQNETQMNNHIGGGHYREREQHNGVHLQYNNDNMNYGKWAVYGVLR